MMSDSVALFQILEWSREALLEKWMKDPVQCCQLAGVQPPTSALQHCASEPSSSVTLQCSNVEPPGIVQLQGTAKPCAETIVSILLFPFGLGIDTFRCPVIYDRTVKVCLKLWHSICTSLFLLMFYSNIQWTYELQICNGNEYQDDSILGCDIMWLSRLVPSATIRRIAKYSSKSEDRAGHSFRMLVPICKNIQRCNTLDSNV